MFTLTVRGSTLDLRRLRTSDPDVQNRFRAVRVKLVLLCVNDK